MGTDDNILFLRPSKYFYWVCVVLIGVQVLILIGQRRHPRFFVPKVLRIALISGYYKYEHTFSSEAGQSDYEKD